MNNDLTEILFIQDRSGSMNSIADDAIGGFNAFVASQKEEPGQARLTLVQFDHEYQIDCDGVPLSDAPVLNRQNYVPRGNTALYDAIGRGMLALGTRLSITPEDERPGKVIVVIMTDGAENASREFTQSQIAQMINHQQEVYNWDFLFLAANIDTQAVAMSLSIDAGNAVAFTADAEGTQEVYTKTARAVSTMRSTGMAHG